MPCRQERAGRLVQIGTTGIRHGSLGPMQTLYSRMCLTLYVERNPSPFARSVSPQRRVAAVYTQVRRFLASKGDPDAGASAVEYGLLVAAIAAIIILLVFALGGFVKGAFQDTCDAFNNSSVTSATGDDCTP